MGACDAECAEHAQRVDRHVGQVVRGAHRQVQRVAQRCQRQVRHAGGVEAAAEAGVAVVEAHDAKAAFQQHLDQCVGPARQLHPQAHDQQHRFGAARALVVDLDRQPVGGDAHRVRRR